MRFNVILFMVKRQKNEFLVIILSILIIEREVLQMKKKISKKVLWGGHNCLNKENNYPNLKLKKLFPDKAESREIA